MYICCVYRRGGGSPTLAPRQLADLGVPPVGGGGWVVKKPLTAISMSILNELGMVQGFLNHSKQYNLSAECVLTAIKLVRDNPDAELNVVLEQALNSWDIYQPTEEDCWDGDGSGEWT